ncbi:MAG: hypothetical protein WA579_09880, partial [Rhodomicrobium sp.]
TNPRRVFISGQKRGVHGAIKRELKRRSAIEAVIGHMKADGHLGRCYLKGRQGDAANAILTAVGHNLGEVLKLLENWRGASFADENQQTGFGEPGKGAPHDYEDTCFAAHA